MGQEEDFKERCLYCGAKVDPTKMWDSGFSESEIYKTIKCSGCERELRVKMSFFEAKDDDEKKFKGKSEKSSKGIKTLESKVKIVDETPKGTLKWSISKNI